MSYETDFDSALTILLGKAVGAITLTGIPAPTTPTGGSTTTTGPTAVSAGIEFVIDGGGAAITPGVKGGLIVPFDCQLQKVVLQEFEGNSGSVDVAIQKATPGPSPSFTSILGTPALAISAGRYYADSALTGWTTTIFYGDALRFVVNSGSGIQRVTVMMFVRRTDLT